MKNKSESKDKTNWVEGFDELWTGFEKEHAYEHPEERSLMRVFISLAIAQARADVLDFISDKEGWEDTRDYYAALLDIPRKYKGFIAKNVDELLKAGRRYR